MAAGFVGLLVVLGWLASVSAEPAFSRPTAADSASAYSKSNATQIQLIEACRADKHCALLEIDGSAPNAPALFLAAVTNEEVDTVVLAVTRYTLNVQAWAKFKDNPYLRRHNLTVLCAVSTYGLLDFSLMERRVLIASDATVTFQSIALANIRKLGGWGIDFFAGQQGSQLVLQDVVRVKPACQQPTTTLKSAVSFQRVSSAYPPNQLTLWPQFCLNVAIDGPTVEHHCYDDVLHFDAFSNIAASDDPNLGQQYPGYILFQQNTTRICQATISQQCIDQNNGDEELCLVMLITGTTDNSSKFVWTSGAIAGVTIAAAAVVVGVALCLVYRHHLVLWCLRLYGKSLQDMESGSREWVKQHALPLALGHLDPDGLTDANGTEYAGSSSLGYHGRRAISQQVTLGVLLGAGSFGRVYKGRWHSSDVAIKIMSCNPDELPKMLKEAEVMMQLNHPNIVRAFHASVWNPAEQSRALKAREARTSGSNAVSTDASRRRTPRRCSSPTPSNGHSNHNSHDQLSHHSGSAVSPAVSAGQHLSTSRSNCIQPAAAPRGDPVVIDVEPQDLDPTRPSTNRFGPGRDLRAVAGHNKAAVDDTAQRLCVRGPADVAAGNCSVPASLPALIESGYRVPCTGQRQRDNTQQLIAAQIGHSRSSIVEPQLQQAGTGAGFANAGSGPNLHSCSSSAAEQAGCLSYTGHSQGLTSSGPTPLGEARESVEQQQQAMAMSPRSAEAVVQETALSPGAESGRSASQQQQPQPDQLQQQQPLRQHPFVSSMSSSHSLEGPALSTHVAAAGPREPQQLPQWTAGMSPQSTSEPSVAVGLGSSGASKPGGMPLLGPGVAILQQDPAEVLDSDSGHAAHRQGQTKGRARHSSEPQNSFSTGTDTHGRQHKRTEVQVWIVLELCTGGTLKDAVTSSKLSTGNKIEMGQLLSRLLDAANGMAYLHSKGIMHGDLKAGNVLLQNLHGGCDQVAKISDFGLAAVLLDGATHRSTASMGTITHMAPEVLKSGRMSLSADVYSFAIMMWEVLTNQSAYQGLHYGAVVERVVVRGHRPVIPDYVPEGFAILMQACWDADPEKRPTFDQIVTCLELMIDNLSSDGDSSGSGAHADSEVELAFPSGSIRSLSGTAAAAAVANHLQQSQRQQQQQAVVPLPDVSLLRSAARFGQVGQVGSSTAGSQAQPLTPSYDQPQPNRHSMVDWSMKMHEGSTAQSSQSGSRGARSTGRGQQLPDPQAHSGLDANQFVHDL